MLPQVAQIRTAAAVADSLASAMLTAVRAAVSLSVEQHSGADVSAEDEGMLIAALNTFAALLKDVLRDTDDVISVTSKGQVTRSLVSGVNPTGRGTMGVSFVKFKGDDRVVTIARNTPRQLGLKPILKAFVAHRRDIVRRRSQFDLDRANKRLHEVEGLIRAIDMLDEVIATIRSICALRSRWRRACPSRACACAPNRSRRDDSTTCLKSCR